MHFAAHQRSILTVRKMYTNIFLRPRFKQNCGANRENISNTLRLKSFLYECNIARLKVFN